MLRYKPTNTIYQNRKEAKIALTHYGYDRAVSLGLIEFLPDDYEQKSN